MINKLKEMSAMGETENGALTYNSTLNKCLDLFALGGAYRNRTEEDIVKLFLNAYKEDPQTALRLLFYLRDIRGGQGERKFFRVAIRQLAIEDSITVKKIAHLISEYGRYDDLMCFVGTPIEDYVFTLIKQQLEEDVLAEFPTLCAKWMPSENASSKQTKALAKVLRKSMEMNSKDYRKMLSSIRAKINLVETLMSENRWTEVEYKRLPSKAGLQYKAAFARHDYERYSEFMTPSEDGKITVNAGTLYPYEIVGRVLSNMSYSHRFNGSEVDRNVLNAYWENLTDYLNGESSNSLSVIDVSGSMEGRPVEVAISLGMYMAEKNTGVFGNHFLTFSNKPQLVEIKGKDFVDKVCNIHGADWGNNTNIKSVFDLILTMSIKNDLDQSEIPEMLYVISDMEFDSAVGRKYDTTMETIKKEWLEAGYKLPHIVYWNVDARQNNIPVIGEGDYSLISGFSPSIFEQIVKKMPAHELMMSIVNSDRYSKIKL